MRPILLKGHERPITTVKYNREGDLLVTCAKDASPCVWYTDSGERLGVFEGHTGAVWACDISYNSEFLLTAAADSKIKLWDMKTGRELFNFPLKGVGRRVNFNTGDTSFVAVTDHFMNEPAAVHIYDIAEDVKDQSSQPRLTIVKHGHKGRVSGAYWTAFNKHIMTTGVDGMVKLFDPETGKLVSEQKVHTNEITDVSFNKEKFLAITSSKDCRARLIDMETMTVLKTYETDRPVNSAAISPFKPHVVLGGGEEAMTVTGTAGRTGKFEARFFHMVYEEEVGRVKGHFGPINTIAFHPNGKQYTSGAEDGYVRMHNFDPEYFKEEENEEVEKEENPAKERQQ